MGPGQFNINITVSVGPDLAILVKCKMRVSRALLTTERRERESHSIKKSPVPVWKAERRNNAACTVTPCWLIIY